MVKSESMTVTLQILNSPMFCIFFVETFRFAISIHACRTKYFTIDTGKQISDYSAINHLKEYQHKNKTFQSSHLLDFNTL